MGQSVTQTFQGIRRVEIVNGSEKAVLESSRTPQVTIEGVFSHELLGLSRAEDSLYLIGFDGRISLPNNVALKYLRGIDDLPRELFRIYAPSLDYQGMLETTRMAGELQSYRDVPVAEIVKILHRFTDSTCSPFLASQQTLYQPATMKLIERNIRAQAFRWDGPYNFLPRLRAGNFALIPSIMEARTLDEIKLRANDFIVDKLYVKGNALAALLGQINQWLRETSGERLARNLAKLQESMVRTEAAARAIATTVKEKTEAQLEEGVRDMQKQRLPYGATLVQNFAAIGYPISLQQWIPIMAKVAAQESRQRGRKGSSPSPSAPASAQTTNAAVQCRSDADWEAALNDKQSFCMCLHSVAMRALEQHFNTASERFKRVETPEQIRKWLPDVASYETHTGYGASDNYTRRATKVTFTSDPEHNSYTIEKVGRECNDELRGPEPASPSPGPSPEESLLPTSAPSDETRGSFSGFSIPLNSIL
jgi:hypothetical protein